MEAPSPCANQALDRLDAFNLHGDVRRYAEPLEIAVNQVLHRRVLFEQDEA